jgi:hypothetical protein
MAHTVKSRPSTPRPAGAGVRRTVSGLTGVALLAWFFLWLGGFLSTPREVLEIRALVDAEVANLDKVARGEVPYSNEWSSTGDVFGRMREMPEGARDQAREEVGRLFRARERAELASYFALPPAKRQAELDRRIKAEQQRRKAWEQERASRADGREASGGQGQNRQPGQGRPPGGQNGGGGGPGGPAGGGAPGQRGTRTDEQILARRKDRLDQSSPEERARSAEYRRAMTVRRNQLGISPGRGRGA